MRSDLAHIPWMQVADNLLERLGFKPAEHVYFSVNHHSRQICISADHG